MNLVRRHSSGALILLLIAGMLLALTCESLTNPAPKLKWRIPYTGWDFFTSSPALGSDGTIYIVCSDTLGHTSLCAFSPGGAEKWRVATPRSYWSSPSIGPTGTIYVLSKAGDIYAVNPWGALRWHYQARDAADAGEGSPGLTPAIGTDGTIYGTAELVRNDSVFHSALFALDPDGRELWQFVPEVSQRLTTPVLAPDRTIYVSDWIFGGIFAVNPDGTLRWHLPMDTIFLDSAHPFAVAGDGSIYFIADSYWLGAVSPEGALRWRRDLGDALVGTSPVIGPDNRIYVNDGSSLWAFGSDGTRDWVCPHGSSIRYASPVIGASGTIYQPSGIANGASKYDYYLCAISPEGAVLWRRAMEMLPEGASVIAPDGTIYVPDAYGYLSAFQGDEPLSDAPWPMAQHDPNHTGRAGK